MLQVCVRVRPLLQFESEPLWFANKQTVHSSKKQFTYDSVETEIKTQTIYNSVAKPLVKKALSGYHTTIMCYGQTTSGKTFTTLGRADNPGILPCALRDVFQQPGVTVHVQYIQIYNESIDDLLDGKNTQIKIVEDNNYGTTLQLKRIKVGDFQSAVRLLNSGEERRIYRETQIHERSSRSHTMFKIYIEHQNKFSCLNIVDLAGSERISDVDVNHETGYINKSLLSLTNVINQLADQKQHISYRDSKLTRLLSNSLGGNSYTLLICCISPGNHAQTLTTLQFAQRAKKVENDPKENVFNKSNTISSQFRVTEFSTIEQERKSVKERQLLKFFADQQELYADSPMYEKFIQLEQSFSGQFHCLLKQYLKQISLLNSKQFSSLIQEFHDLVQQFPVHQQPTQAKTIQFQSVNHAHQPVYIWGSGQDGRLGLGDEKSLKIPTLLPNIKFSSIACGYHHTLGISEGKIYAWGRGQRGQLGIGSYQTHQTPQLISTLHNVSDIACGWQHSLAISDGNLYTWGYGEDGQLGDGECMTRNAPVLIDTQVSNIYAGHSTSGYLKAEMLYTFGNNEDGRCMIDCLGVLATPEQVQLNDIVHASLGVSHMGVVTADGHVYMAGTSTFGQLGTHDNSSTWFTQLDRFGPQNKASKIGCGDCYTLVLNSRGFVYTFGKGTYKRNGQNDCQNLFEPTPLQMEAAVDIVCGCRHGGAITKDGTLYLWGFNFHNQLGLGDNDEDQSPIKVTNFKAAKVSLGYFHSAALIK